MIKKLGILLGVLVVASVFVGCAKVADNAGSSTSNLPSGVTVGSPIPSPEAVLTGSVAKYSGTPVINLGGIIPTGSSESVTIDLAKMRAYVASGMHTSGITSLSDVAWTSLSLGFYSGSATPIDIVFVLDNTSSMSYTIDGVKESIAEFASTLEAHGVDAKFALVTYGDSALHPTPAGYITSEGFSDAYSARPILDFSTAAALSSILSTEVTADGGGDYPENPLDAIKWALKTNPTTGVFTNLTWRAGAQKIFVILTDITGHQTSEATFINGSGDPVTDESSAVDASSDNHCTTTALLQLANLKNFNAKVYAVSPNYETIQAPYADVRMLADGFGEGRTTAEANLLSTGGQWIRMPGSGIVDLSELGISSTIVSGRTIRLEGYTFAAGTVYTIIVYYDVDGDGIMDSYSYFVYSATSTTGTSLGIKGIAMPADDWNKKLNN